MKIYYTFLMYGAILALQFQNCQAQSKNSSIDTASVNGSPALPSKEEKSQAGVISASSKACDQSNHAVSFFVGAFGDVDHDYKVGDLSCNENQTCGNHDFDSSRGKSGRRCFADYCLYTNLNGRCIKYNADQNIYEYSSCMGGTRKQCYISERCAKDALCNFKQCVLSNDFNYTNIGIKIINGVPVTVLKDKRCTCGPAPVPEPEPIPEPDPVPSPVPVPEPEY